jgi:hypothetical protein
MERDRFKSSLNRRGGEINNVYTQTNKYIRIRIGKKNIDQKKNEKRILDIRLRKKNERENAICVIW